MVKWPLHNLGVPWIDLHFGRFAGAIDFAWPPRSAARGDHRQDRLRALEIGYPSAENGCSGLAHPAQTG